MKSPDLTKVSGYCLTYPDGEVIFVKSETKLLYLLSSLTEGNSLISLSKLEELGYKINECYLNIVAPKSTKVTTVKDLKEFLKDVDDSKTVSFRHENEKGRASLSNLKVVHHEVYDIVFEIT